MLRQGECSPGLGEARGRDPPAESNPDWRLSLQASVPPLCRDVLQTTESSGGEGWGLASISWWLPWEFPRSFVPASHNSLTGNCMPCQGDACLIFQTGQVDSVIKTLSCLHSPHSLLLWGPRARPRAQGTHSLPLEI